MSEFECGNLILGAGIAGISAAYYLKKSGIDSVCIEQEEQPGGLCRSFKLEGYTYDYFVHLSFSKDKEVIKLFQSATDIIVHNPESMNYVEGQWVRHPVQNNLYSLPVEEKIKILKGFIERSNKEINNYEDWLKSQYGDYFSEHYPMRYTRKYWGVNADQLGTDWIEGRIYNPSIDEILYSALMKHTPNVFYAKEMRYPVNGGFQSFLNGINKNLEINLKKEVIKIDENKKIVYLKSKDKIKYENLISTLPLKEMGEILTDPSQKLKEAASKLCHTSGFIISIALNKKIEFPSLWFYIYDEDIIPARIYSPSMKSSQNTPEGKSSLQAEIYFSNISPNSLNAEDMLKCTMDKLVSMKLFKHEDVEFTDIRFVKYANVICNSDISENRKIVTDYLKRKGIICAGRFGEWEYYWSDQSLLSGKRASKLIQERMR